MLKSEVTSATHRDTTAGMGNIEDDNGSVQSLNDKVNK